MAENYLITGASGFLGNYVLKAVNEGSAQVYCIGRSPLKATAHIGCDLAVDVPVLPDMVFQKVIHIAGKAHTYPKTPEESLRMYSDNVAMAENLLKALDTLSNAPEQIIYISSVAVYGCEKGVLLNEEYPTNAVSPYGKAKLAAEELLSAWAQRHGAALLVLRLPLIAGIHPPGNLGAIKKAIQSGVYIRVKNNVVRKSVVLASDVADLIRRVDTGKSGIYHLSDGEHPSIRSIENAFETNMNKKIRISLPFRVLSSFARVGDLLQKVLGKDMPLNSNKLEKLTSELTFSDDKAVRDLMWKPAPAVDFLRTEA